MNIRLIILVSLIMSIAFNSSIKENRISTGVLTKEFKAASADIKKTLNIEDNKTNILNNKSLAFDKAIKNGYVVMISYINGVSDITQNDAEVYNSNKLDRFIENVKSGKRDKVRIIEYEKNETKVWINKLYDIEYNGIRIVDIGYDVYTNPNAFKPVDSPYYSDIMEKRDYPNALWYGLCTKKGNESSCYSLISFFKSSIVDRN